ncbi:Uso1 [Symbiodinium pilosum]|uniref:Uso1 protein n=1 Tax=Symbiodinium pilosum TaxID=2952 RepID=A0A812JPU6_SYMPI|nr:Uso1 [Symbiodinium pilosum]
MVHSLPWWCSACPKYGDADDCDVVEFTGDPPPSPEFELLDAEKEELQVAVVRGFLSPKEVLQVTGMRQAFALKEIDDRDDDLIYRHEVWRMEHELKEALPKVYTRLMDHCRALDNELWCEIEADDRFYPEIEYIQYDVGKLGEPGTIEPHTDNESQVTVIVLLSQPTEFAGGVNHFEPGWKGGDSRRVKLAAGDAAFFYGDRCEHWITPVTSGRRTILQMELSRGWRHCCFGLCSLCWGC